MSLEQLLSAVFGLAVAVPGFAVLISALVNVLKWLKIVPDGAAEMWFKVLTVLSAVGLGLWVHFDPSLLDKLPAIDIIAGQVGNLLMILITIFGAALLRDRAYDVVKGLPLVGHSNTKG